MMSNKQLEEIASTVRGIPVRGCLPGSTAAEAGVRFGDIVLAVNGVPTPGIDEYIAARALRSDGYELRLFRDGQEFTLFVPFRKPTDPLETLATQIAEGRFVSPEPADLPVLKAEPN
jgi:S1-C subfamily serine protease